MAVNPAGRKEVAYRFTADGEVKEEVKEEGDVKPKLEIAYEDELRPAVDAVDGVIKLEGEATVDAISVKPEPL